MDGDVGLLHMREHFLVELFAKTGERGHHGFGVGVLGFEVRGDLRVLLVAEPGVVVDEDGAVERGFSVLLAGDGWGSCHCFFSLERRAAFSF
jgi:hypothetical protein